MAVYLDHNATTPLQAKVFETMEPYLTNAVGNASSLHRYGRNQRAAIDTAREQVARLVGAQADQVVFTSGGTEANNLLIKGLLKSINHIAISEIEHMSVLEPAESAKADGCELDFIAVDNNGRVSEADVERAVKNGAGLVSVMTANNETGAVQNIKKFAKIARENNVFFHTDASQAVGKVPVNFNTIGGHAMTVSAHKIYGPMGIGALIVDKSLSLQSMLHGGMQEKGKRAGTENVAAIVGFGMAAELAMKGLDAYRDHTKKLSIALEEGLSQFADVVVFSQSVERLPNTVQFGVKGFDGETLLMQLDKQGFAVSSGSACTSGKTEPSHVLKAMKIDNDIALSAIRVSFGLTNTLEHVEGFLRALTEVTGIKHTEVMMAASI